MNTAPDAGVRLVQSAPMNPDGKWRNLFFLSLAESLAMTLWFSASAVIPQLTLDWGLGASEKSWLTMSVQAGFVAGALTSAILNLADRLEPRHLIAASILLAAAFNAAIPVFDLGLTPALAMRFLTGAALAGVYPPGMKLVATWHREDLGLGIGILVGALAIGNAAPHLINVVPVLGTRGMPPWRGVLLATSSLSVVAAVISVFFLRRGPYLTGSAPFDWRFVGRALAHTPTRLANFGYLGHMWELYAMWAWVPILLIASYEAAGWSVASARVAGFCAIGVGALGCVIAGKLSDRFGRTAITVWSLAVSGACAIGVGFCYHHPPVLTGLCLIWGFAVVADSAQFSAAVSELTDTRYVGTALTLQTSLGFLLTLVTIRVIPALMEAFGWERAFVVLAVGPAIGVWSMLALRRHPESQRMASGKR